MRCQENALGAWSNCLLRAERSGLKLQIKFHTGRKLDVSRRNVGKCMQSMTVPAPERVFDKDVHGVAVQALRFTLPDAYEVRQRLLKSNACYVLD
mmetsp:Transcript_33419/g.76362  ORF Transcript_33419/g.76362 Transcript_33419/m.76362 type:complete len:95 (+) Transcript_33419:1428-1712(+)